MPTPDTPARVTGAPDWKPDFKEADRIAGGHMHIDPRHSGYANLSRAYLALRALPPSSPEPPVAWAFALKLEGGKRGIWQITENAAFVADLPDIYEVIPVRHPASRASGASEEVTDAEVERAAVALYLTEAAKDDAGYDNESEACRAEYRKTARAILRAARSREEEDRRVL